ncbi:MAG: TIGR04211 family SH3 domain-containing protein [Steroidobacteraceae bacterium]
MKLLPKPAALTLALLALLSGLSGLSAQVRAATAYVSDELVLGVYTEQNGQGQRLATLHSGATVETLSVNGDYTQVRLNDGTTGWVKSAYLTTQEPATLRVKQLQEELDGMRATTPGLAVAAARSELEQLKSELANKQSELEAARRAVAAPVPAPGATETGSAASTATPVGLPHPWILVGALLAALACGFWLGYSTLARRVRNKFGGIKVY